MKQASQPARLLRVVQVGIASAAFALVAACGGGGDDNNNNANSTPAGGVNLQVVSFGTSLSDVGTYSPVIQASFGGGRFTTNPGEIWTQKVAEYYGGTLTPAFLGGFGKPLVASTGLGYGQGGSLVTGPNGIGHAAPPLPSFAQATTVPVATQVQNYLSAHGSFNSNQLVLVEGGANDVIQQAQLAQAAIMTAVANGTDPNIATQQAVGAAAAALQTAATQMVTQVIQPILTNGATHVVVANVADIAVTPQGVMGGASGQLLFKTLTGAFNQTLAGTLAGAGLSGKVIYVQTDNGLTASRRISRLTGSRCPIPGRRATSPPWLRPPRSSASPIRVRSRRRCSVRRRRTRWPARTKATCSPIPFTRPPICTRSSRCRSSSRSLRRGLGK